MISTRIHKGASTSKNSLLFMIWAWENIAVKVVNSFKFLNRGGGDRLLVDHGNGH